MIQPLLTRSSSDTKRLPGTLFLFPSLLLCVVPLDESKSVPSEDVLHSYDGPFSFAFSKSRKPCLLNPKPNPFEMEHNGCKY